MHNVCAKEITRTEEMILWLFNITITIKGKLTPASNINEKIAQQKPLCSPNGTDTMARPSPVES